MRRTPSCLTQCAEAALERLTVVRAQGLRQRHVAADLRGGSLSAVVVLVVEVDGRAVRGRQPGVGLPALVVGDEPKEDERDRHHRDDDDEDEEQRQPVAKAHGCSCADVSASSAGRSTRSPPAPNAGYTWRPPGAIAQLGERLDRTQEVGGSSPPSSIAEEPLLRRGFSRSGDHRRPPRIALCFRHQCLYRRDETEGHGAGPVPAGETPVAAASPAGGPQAATARS